MASRSTVISPARICAAAARLPIISTASGRMIPTAPTRSRKVTIDPKSNGGERAEVSMKGISGGKPMGAGPGGSFISDVEIRYALGRGDPGLYTYSIFEHQPDYPASSLGEARFCTKLADLFDWMSVGPKWNKPYPKARARPHMKTSTTSPRTSSTTRRSAGQARPRTSAFWFLNPSVEYPQRRPD